MVYQDNRIITLNSQDGEKVNGTYLSNINFNFSGLLSDDNNIVRTYITVLNAQFPVSFYIIDETDNMLYYTEDSVEKTIELVPGNYNGNQMVTALNGVFASNGTPVTVQLNSTTGLLYFFITGGVSITILATSTVKSILGFDTDITSTTFIKMPYQLNLLGKKKIFINSNYLRNSAFSSKSLSCVQTIATVPVDQPPYSMISYVSVSDLEKNIIFNRSLDILDIQIVDEENKYINFRNINWSITLCLSIEKDDRIKLKYGLYDLPPPSLDQNLENKNNIVKLSRDEKDLKLLES